MNQCPYDWQSVCAHLSEHAQAKLAAGHLSACLGRAPTPDEVETQMMQANPGMVAPRNRASEAAWNERRRLEFLPSVPKQDRRKR